MSFRPRRPSPALLVALLALFVALGGPAQAAKLINGKNIRKGSVASRQVKDRSLSTRDLTKASVRNLIATPAKSVGTEELKDAAVGAAQLQVGSVTAAALAPNSITGTSLADATLGAADLADGSVTQAKLASAAVRKVHIATGAVGTSEIQSSSVTTNEVRDGTLTAKDLGDFSGVVAPEIPQVLSGACVTVRTAGVSPNVAGSTLEDDIVLVGRPVNWPPALALDAQPADATSLNVTVCNLGTQPVPAFTPSIPFVGVQP